MTVNGVLVTACASANKQVVTYFANTNGNGTFGNAGDTPYYRLTLNQSGAGTYTFDVLFTPPPPTLQLRLRRAAVGPEPVRHRGRHRQRRWS